MGLFEGSQQSSCETFCHTLCTDPFLPLQYQVLGGHSAVLTSTLSWVDTYGRGQFLLPFQLLWFQMTICLLWSHSHDPMAESDTHTYIPTHRHRTERGQILQSMYQNYCFDGSSSNIGEVGEQQQYGHCWLCPQKVSTIAHMQIINILVLVILEWGCTDSWQSFKNTMYLIQYEN